MARVYKVHHYTDVIAAKAYLLSGFKKGRFRDNAINAACDEDYTSLRAECDELDFGSETESCHEDAVAMVAMREGIDRVMTYANANTVVYHENGWSFQLSFVDQMWYRTCTRGSCLAVMASHLWRA